MALTVNTLAEVPDAEGYIVEVGLEGTNHPANQIDRDQIRDELGIDEWYVRTGSRTEEQKLMLQVDEQVNHSRLPAYLILTSHPQNTEDAVVIYLSEVDSKDTAWELLRIAISEMQDMRDNTESKDSVALLARKIAEDHALETLSISANVVTVIQFAGV